MRKRYKLLFAGVFVGLAGCSTPNPVLYKSDISIKPSQEKNVYLMDLSLYKSDFGEYVKIFTAPPMLIEKDKEAVISAGENVQMKCTVLVTENDGQTKANTDIRIQNIEKEKSWDFKQELLLKAQGTQEQAIESAILNLNEKNQK